MKTLARLTLIGACTVACLSSITMAAQSVDAWPSYGHDPGGLRYSPLTQISRENVSQLKVAWVFHTGDISDGSGHQRRSGFETTPILVDGTLYLTTPFNRVIALDPETGKQRWAYDPKIDLTGDYGDGLINRGVSTWLDSASPAGKPCHRRIYEATLDARLIALDAATGSPCADFGKAGEVSLRDVPAYRPGWYHMTSPPAVIADIVVVGSAIDDNGRVDMPNGVVRAFDARSGALRWSWDPIKPNPVDGKAWRSGAANAWSVMAVDQERDLVFVPTGSASPDYYGGLRPGDNKWANSVVALRAKTGEVAWGFQLVHHDLWDYDTASPPLLATLPQNGKKVPVVIQGNKTGFLYVLNRETGTPVFPVEERPVPQSDVPGEVTSPTQPFPVAPPALTPQRLTADDVWGLTPADRETCRQWLAGMRNEGIFTPPTVKGTLAVPGNIGGPNWSGYAFDPQRNLLIATSTNVPFKVRVIPRAEFEDRASRSEPGEYSDQTGAPYGMFRRPFFSPSHLPCIAPPWGTLAAVDMAEGKIRWQVALGSMQDFAPGHASVPPGSPIFGGPMVSAGGLVFVAGTVDPFIRAFDVETGKELWKAQLPASGHALPMTYQLKPNGKQYVVIAAGGHAKISEEPLGDAVVAFALP
jgi:quinoprotein glucose dehydrogenase